MRALVTGAAGGLGKHLVRALRARGDEVLATDRAAGAGVDLVLDVTSSQDWDRALAHVRGTWGELDLLVNNAGVASGGRVDVEELAEWHHAFDVNLFGAVRGAKAFAPLLKEQRSGRIVNIASLAGLVHPAGMGSYNASKAAVVAFTETLGHELAPFGVQAQVVCPSFFRTGLAHSGHGADAPLGQLMATLIASSAYGPAEVAAEVLKALETDDDVVLTEHPGRVSVELKQTDRAAYNAKMRRQADKVAHLPLPDA